MRARVREQADAILAEARLTDRLSGPWTWYGNQRPFCARCGSREMLAHDVWRDDGPSRYALPAYPDGCARVDICARCGWIPLSSATALVAAAVRWISESARVDRMAEGER